MNKLINLQRSFASAVLAGSLFLIAPAHAETLIKVYKNPSCGCCTGWVEHLQKNGFSADVTATKDRSSVHQQMGVPRDKGACHTAVVGGYFIEGHVPAADIKRLLEQKPDIAGLTVPGMPVGSPGMENPKYPAMDYNVLAIDKSGKASVFSHHPGTKN